MLNPLNILSKFIKSRNQRELDKLQNIVNEVNKLENGGTQVISEVSLEIEGQDKPAYVAETIMVAFP